MKMVHNTKPVTGLAPITPSTTTPDFVSMKGYQHLTIFVLADNATTVTGSAITLLQSTVVAGTDEKELAFTKVWQNVDTAASDALVETAVANNTFTTAAVDNKNSLYVIEVEADQLDVTNDFDCVRIGTGDAVATVLSVLYVLSEPRYTSATPPTAITD
ncbi:MAG: hypothetical protein WC069_06920 [Candidatus Shapirobacteria bacterium]